LKKTKILVTGFPHSGTSILKSKLGECSNLHEVPFETAFVRPEDMHYSGDKENILIKYPMLPIDIRAGGIAYTRHPDSRYYEYTIIMVIRNPWNVYTGMIKAGSNPMNNLTVDGGNSEYHSKVEEYEVAAELFRQARDNNYPNIYAIRYEDFFPNNFEKLRELMDKLNLQYTEELFTNRTKDYIHWPGKEYANIKNNEDYQSDRYAYRTWQINQPFQNMNSEVNIPDELSDILKNSNIVQELGYSDPRITD
jgi:hypothetical protein